jgi:hypothetical protein
MSPTGYQIALPCDLIKFPFLHCQFAFTLIEDASPGVPAHLTAAGFCNFPESPAINLEEFRISDSLKIARKMFCSCNSFTTADLESFPTILRMRHNDFLSKRLLQALETGCHYVLSFRLDGAGRGIRTPDGFLRWITDPVQYQLCDASLIIFP